MFDLLVLKGAKKPEKHYLASPEVPTNIFIVLFFYNMLKPNFLGLNIYKNDLKYRFYIFWQDFHPLPQHVMGNPSFSYFCPRNEWETCISCSCYF